MACGLLAHSWLVTAVVPCRVRSHVATHTHPPPRRFAPAGVRRVCAEVVEAELHGKQWCGEEEAVLAVAMTDAITKRVKCAWLARGARTQGGGGERRRQCTGRQCSTTEP